MRKLQRPAQKQYGILEAFMINFILIIFCYLKQCLPTDFGENLLAREKKFQVKDWCRILGSDILHYEEFYCNLCQSQRKTNYTRQNENSFDSLASN